MSRIKKLRVVVKGRVQGVFFRAYTKDEAEKLGLAGWVRNRADGSVEAIIEGEATAVEEMTRWFHQGSPQSLVEKVQVEEELSTEDLVGFEIRY